MLGQTSPMPRVKGLQKIGPLRIFVSAAKKVFLVASVPDNYRKQSPRVLATPPQAHSQGCQRGPLEGSPAFGEGYN